MIIQSVNFLEENQSYSIEKFVCAYALGTAYTVGIYWINVNDNKNVPILRFLIFDRPTKRRYEGSGACPTGGACPVPPELRCSDGRGRLTGGVPPTVTYLADGRYSHSCDCILPIHYSYRIVRPCHHVGWRVTSNDDVLRRYRYKIC